ncbi:MAG: aminotransferase class I/II-fold pyridoxal phosphate-dependent enzyme [Bacilli bacterium]|nr:aminotransferase class I/II-fold pyridoxal phosphate-dependent enzyme [Bacilli bacterium]
MQAVILAAGKGTRLGHLGKEIPKCLCSIAKKLIIERAIDNFVEANIKDFVIVINYKAEKIKEHLLKVYPELNFTFVDENDYENIEHNNIYSLVLALPFIKKDFILVEGDIIFEVSTLKQLIKDKKSKAVLSTYAPYLNGSGVVVKNNKCIALQKYSNQENLYKTVNLYYISNKNKVKKDIDKFTKINGYNHYYEEAFNIKQFKPYIVEPENWYEVDTVADLDVANIIYSSGEEKYKLLSERYGGHWMIPGLIDCCYLTNPFFDIHKIFNSIDLGLLASSYPAGEKETRAIAANLFNLSADNILVGNGATELISVLGRHYRKYPTYMTYPTFNEYDSAFDRHNKAKFEKADVVIIVNPNNPTGDYTDPGSILKLVDKYSSKIFIIDESFNDFVEEKLKKSFIGCKYDNVIVVKSLGKSYGINGLKLGILYSHNKKIIESLKELMPSWNVNSISQEVLSQLKAYESKYKLACKELILERENLILSLRLFNKHIKVYNTQTDFLYIKLLDVDSHKFCVDMLDKYNIFIKDLSNKKGLEGQNYIRLSINDKKTNSFVCGCFTEYFYKV